MNLASVFGGDWGLSDDSKITPIVFVVDDDISVRESAELLIRSEGWQSETFGSAQDFLARPQANVPSCLILDVALPSLDGLELQKWIPKERSEMPIIFIAGRGDVPTTVQAMKAGGVEFLTKPFNKESLLGAIRKSLQRSDRALRRKKELHELQRRYQSLTRRERQVMALVISGFLNKQAGLELRISEITVKAHRRQVMRKMKANSLPDLVRMAERLRVERPVTTSRLLGVTDLSLRANITRIPDDLHRC